jgi:hypothetical protein
MVSSFVLAVGLLVLRQNGVSIPSHLSLIGTVILTTVVWLAATWLTPATDAETLRRFYTLARPAGPGWAAVRRACGDLAATDDLSAAVVGSLASCACIYAALFGSGFVLMGRTQAASIAVVVALVSGAITARSVSRLWRA